MFDPPDGTPDLESQALALRGGASLDAYQPPAELLAWEGETIVVSGHTMRVRKPKPEALQAFSMAISKYSPARTQNDMVALFVRSHMSPESYEELLVRMMDPEDRTISMDDLGKIMREIATLGTNRPTGPLRT